MAQTSMLRTAKKASPANDSATGAKPLPEYEELPDPVIIDAFALIETGTEIEGVVLEVEEGNYGKFFKIKTSRPCKCKQRDAEPKLLPAGTIVGVNETAKLRQLHAHLKRGPTSVRIRVGERKADGRGYEMSVAVRPAF